MLLNLVYGFAILLLSPWLTYRSIRTGRYRRNLREKFLGRSTATSDLRPAIWFHGVSVGEVHLLRQLVKAFRERHPDWRVVVSSTTDTGLAEARKHFSDLEVIAYPFDFSWAVRRTIRSISPMLIVLAESELWPNFLRAANRLRVSVVVANGRMSPRSFRRYSKLAGLARRLFFNQIREFGMQSEMYATNLRNLGVQSVQVTGNVKYDGVLLDRENSRTAELGRQLGIETDDLVWVAGSTHDPEERIVLSVFSRLRERFPRLRLILVPRAPERFEEVAQLIAAAGLSHERRSKWPTDSTSPSVILIDTMGELGPAWGLATIGFTGGSLNDKRGGQSMIEPAAFGVPVLFGPHTWNFKDAVAGLLDCKGAMRIADEGELEKEVLHLIEDPELRVAMGQAARSFVVSQQGATVRTLDMMDAVLV
ncbi:MAG: 3-deoxy-D-manno-octulosonic acid transferase [Gemmataceae bacterium]|nr:3-deoxy-D-manno-octulosonic acid transferase [Gemmataceae bacterium]